MSQNQRVVKGMRDLFAREVQTFRDIVGKSATIASSFGFQEIETPILEHSGVFLRSLGDTSDIVSKEMYRFTDSGGEDLVLRPEGTAPIARAFVTLGLNHSVPLKLFYSGPMFRRERPQKGRYRQFYQFGVEIMGTNSPLADVEAIDLGFQILNQLKVGEKVTVRINTLGDQDSRAAFRQALSQYLESRKSELSADSLVRLEKNPLRILDSKDPQDQALLVGAPQLKDHLSASAKVFFEAVQSGLTSLGLPFTIDPKLVRGLDYYTHTVFEFVTEHIGAQNAVLAGGRYDGLVEQLGGPETPSVGWAFGVDRVALLRETTADTQIRVALVPGSDDLHWPLYQLGQDLKRAGYKVETSYSGTIGKRLSKAAKAEVDFALILGENEKAQNEVVLKNLKSGEQLTVKQSDLVSSLTRLVSSQSPK